MLNIEKFSQRQSEIDTLWSAAQVRALPQRFQAGLLKQRDILNQRGDYAGNIYIQKIGAVYKYPASLASSNDDLIAQANTRSLECARLNTVAGMVRICQRFGIEPPQARFRKDGAACSIEGVKARLKCPLWWRKALRKSMGREVERMAIELGFVHSRAGCYASDETVSRRRQQKARNRALLESISAANELGQEYSLQELSDLGVSNPEIRRGELMTRIAGFESIAAGLGHVGEFYTLTVPSRFHARLSKSGAHNPKYTGNTPREAQAYLCDLWAKARAALHRQGIAPYGFRVVEAHHDGTPHWHMLFFMEPEQVKAVRAVLEKYALEEDGKETGAQKNRFKAVSIDRARGSAAGYIAKYIAKNIDGYGVDVDLEGFSATDSAARVDAWASCWGVRQFQQIGGAPVTVWRELRRLEAGNSGSAIDRAARAADAGDWAGFLQSMKISPVMLWRREMDRAGRYGDTVEKVVGLLDPSTGETVETRVHVWEIKRGAENSDDSSGCLHGAGFECDDKRQRQAAAESGANCSPVDVLYFDVGPGSLAPWSSVNNCTVNENSSDNNKRSLTYAQENSQHHDISGMEFWKCPDGTVICTHTAGFAVGSFEKIGGNGVSPPGMAAKTRREADRVGGGLNEK